MLRGREIRHAAAFLALALWLAASGSHAAEKMIGTSCSSDNSNIDWDTVGQCNNTVFAHGPLILGAMTNPPYSATTCTSSNAGMVQYTSGTLEACNGTSWIPIDGGMHFISTQTASSSASLQFSGANWSSGYNTLFLNCTGLLVSTSPAYLELVVGEGATPTWEAGSHYTNIRTYNWVNGGGPGGGTTTATDILNWVSGAATSTSIPNALKVYIDDVGSSSIYKMATYHLLNYDSSAQYEIIGSSYWNNDTNPITGLEVITSAGNITSGTCSLYGMN
jgi:hypothetical protein